MKQHRTKCRLTNLQLMHSGSLQEMLIWKAAHQDYDIICLYNESRDPELSFGTLGVVVVLLLIENGNILFMRARLSRGGERNLARARLARSWGKALDTIHYGFRKKKCHRIQSGRNLFTPKQVICICCGQVYSSLQCYNPSFRRQLRAYPESLNRFFTSGVRIKAI